MTHLRKCTEDEFNDLLSLAFIFVKTEITDTDIILFQFGRDERAYSIQKIVKDTKSMKQGVSLLILNEKSKL